MTDIVDRLRRWTTSRGVVPAGDIMDEAADEIERLRGEVDRLNQEVSLLVRECQDQKDLLVNGATLTDAEREAVRFFSLIDGPGNVPVANKRAATLRGLLERTGGER